MTSELVSVLKELNFTEYEAKAYMALLKNAPLSGYAVSLQSGVPRSKIYEVLGNLVTRGDVFVNNEETPVYMPLSPEELISRRRHDAERRLDVARECLNTYARSVRTLEGIWNISGRGAILDRVRDGIAKAGQRILLEIWREDAEELLPTLRQASARGVRIVIVSYGALEIDFAEVYHHDMSEQITSEYGGRWIVFSVDDREVVAGILSLGESSRAAWTMHPGLVMPITEVISHDLYIMEILKEFRGVLEERFGADLVALRNKFMMDDTLKKHYVPSALQK
ncbi:TrmB family transcriptional regulator [Aminiphilus sp.]|uniref:TrmB family transcriptional regulator n=1 Tax=Aminiphilus sp. TaxID=1872488 RepID=UPI00262D9546|nr:TrmB family transcriptional regulator [Aminiphilus sp.]